MLDALTSLHSLEYYHRNTSVLWEIVDLQMAKALVNVLDQSISIDKFELLDYKMKE